MEHIVSHHARFFDPQNSNWHPEDGYNETFLQSTAEYVQNRLKGWGHTLVNDVYDSLGMKRTTAGCVEGWMYEAGADDIKMMVFYKSLSDSGGGYIVDFPNTRCMFEEIEDDEELIRRPVRNTRRYRYGPRRYTKGEFNDYE